MVSRDGDDGDDEGMDGEEGESAPGQVESEVQCPFCGEPITILVDCSQDRQTYVEDCSVCCRPIRFDVICEDGEVVSVTAGRD